MITQGIVETKPPETKHVGNGATTTYDPLTEQFSISLFEAADALSATDVQELVAAFDHLSQQK